MTRRLPSNPEEFFRFTPRSFSRKSPIVNLQSSEDYSGVVLDNLDEVETAVGIYLKNYTDGKLSRKDNLSTQRKIMRFMAKEEEINHDEALGDYIKSLDEKFKDIINIDIIKNYDGSDAYFVYEIKKD